MRRGRRPWEDPSRNPASLIWRLTGRTSPERSKPNRPPTKKLKALTDAAKIGIAGGVLAVLIAGGVVYYRRSLA